MSKEERILTLHPASKKGVNIVKWKYDFVKSFILDALESQDDITYQELNRQAIEKLTATFEGKVAWYVVSVKLDLEARGIIERIPEVSQHKIHLVKN